MQYKESLDDSSLISPNMRIFKSSQDKSTFDDETILQIQSVFFSIQNIDPLNINEEAQNIFNILEQIVNSEIFLNSLSSVIPYSVYPQLVDFFNKTKDEKAHYIITRIITMLTNDINSSLTELLKYDIITAIDSSLTNFNFPHSVYLLFQIISNYLCDPNDDVSMIFHQKFSIEYLFQLFQSIQTNFSMKFDEQQTSRWLNCIFITISKYPKELNQETVSVLLKEIIKFKEIIEENSLLSKHFCFSIKTMIEHKLIDYEVFNLYEYPSLLSVLSYNVENEDVRGYSLFVIGILIQSNRYPVAFNFFDFFNELISSNENTSFLLLSSAIFACKSCLIKRLIDLETFQKLSEQMAGLFEFFERQNYTLRFELCSFLAEYIKYFADFKFDALQQFGKVVFDITNLFFDFLGMCDEKNVILNILESFFYLNIYLTDYGYINSPAISEYISNFVDCMNEVQENECKDICELAEKMLNALNEKLNA